MGRHFHPPLHRIICACVWCAYVPEQKLISQLYLRSVLVRASVLAVWALVEAPRGPERMRIPCASRVCAGRDETAMVERSE